MKINSDSNGTINGAINGTINGKIQEFENGKLVYNQFIEGFRNGQISINKLSDDSLLIQNGSDKYIENYYLDNPFYELLRQHK